MKDTQFLFIELQDDALTDGAAFDGVAFGTFKDMLGREIELKADDATSYVENTQAAIEATRAESGELVGLPIDANGHDKGDGAGWIVGVELVGEVIRLIPKWTEIGRELISKGIRRFFSATIDISNKVVIGGTLTNWPATRDDKNRVMLRPIELESGLQTVEVSEPEPVATAPPAIGDEIMADELEEVQEEVPEVATTPPAEIEPDVMADLMRQFENAGQQEPFELAQAVQKQADLIAQNLVNRLMDERQQNWQITQLAAKLTGGDSYGLPVSLVELTAFLQSLDAEQFEVAKKLFTTISKNGLVEFEAVGHGRRMRRKPLPDVYVAPLKAVLAAGNTIADFCQANGLEASDYDFEPYKEV